MADAIDHFLGATLLSGRRKKGGFLDVAKLERRWKSFSEYNLRRVNKAWKAVTRRSTDFFRGHASQVSVGGDDDRLMPTKLSCLNPILLIVHLFGFFVRFAQTRAPLAFFAGLPALIGLLTPIVGDLLLFDNEAEQILGARARRIQAAETGDWEKVEFLSRRMMAMLPGNGGEIVAYCKALCEQGRENEAEQFARSIALDLKVIEPMNWLTQRVFARVTESQADSAPAEEEQLLRDLRWILEQSTEHPQANTLMGRLQLSKGNFKTAKEYFERLRRSPAASRRPAVYFALAMIAAKEGRVETMVSLASEAADLQWEELFPLLVAPPVPFQPLSAYIGYLGLSRRELEAEQFLMSLDSIATDVEGGVEALLLDVRLSYCRRKRTTDNRSAKDLSEAIDALSRAMAMRINHVGVVSELMEFCVTEGMDDALVERQLVLARDSGISPGVVHLINGTRSMFRKPPQTEAAIESFKLAMEHIPQAPALMNNLADAIAEQEEPELDTAFGLIEQALLLLPNAPHLYDTRGKILLHQGNFTAAIADFERALAEESIRAEVYLNLSEAWKLAGNVGESRRYEAMSEQLSRLKADPDLSENPE